MNIQKDNEIECNNQISNDKYFIDMNLSSIDLIDLIDQLNCELEPMYLDITLLFDESTNTVHKLARFLKNNISDLH